MRTPRALAALQVALALVLLVGAGLMVRSFRQLQRVDPGFDVTHALTMQVSLPSERYASSASVVAFVERLTERVEALPGVTIVGAVVSLPLSGSGERRCTPSRITSTAKAASHRFYR